MTVLVLALIAVTLAMITTCLPTAPPATAPAGAGADAACAVAERMPPPEGLSSSVSARTYSTVTRSPTLTLSKFFASGGTVTWRRRECDACKRRFTTYERAEVTAPLVVKKDGQRVAFDRQKVLASLRIACNKRPVSPDQLEEEAETLERELSEGGDREVSSLVIGERVMDRLRRLDQVAYVRFASVYKSFRDIDEFMREMSVLVRPKDGE